MSRDVAKLARHVGIDSWGTVLKASLVAVAGYVVISLIVLTANNSAETAANRGDIEELESVVTEIDLVDATDQELLDELQEARAQLGHPEVNLSVEARGCSPVACILRPHVDISHLNGCSIYLASMWLEYPQGSPRPGERLPGGWTPKAGNIIWIDREKVKLDQVVLRYAAWTTCSGISQALTGSAGPLLLNWPSADGPP
jgi:hypothetical protein